MLLFFSIVLVLVIIITILFFSEVKIDIYSLELSSSYKQLNLQYEGKIYLYFGNLIKIFGIKIDSKENKKILLNKIIKDSTEENKRIKCNKGKNNILKKLKNNMRIEKFNLAIKIDFESVVVTSIATGIISTIIPNLVRNNIKEFNHRSYKFEIFPLYEKQNYVNIKLNSIISMKVVHIISILKLIGGKKNERTSNRRFNAYCNGKY